MRTHVYAINLVQLLSDLMAFSKHVNSVELELNVCRTWSTATKFAISCKVLESSEYVRDD